MAVCNNILTNLIIFHCIFFTCNMTLVLEIYYLFFFILSYLVADSCPYDGIFLSGADSIVQCINGMLLLFINVLQTYDLYT